MSKKDRSFGLTCFCGKAGVWLYRGQPFCSSDCLMREIMKHLTEISRTPPKKANPRG
jgi:endogenous inhibitor of DNA gyrase (YacG/DUF329 family)